MVGILMASVTRYSDDEYHMPVLRNVFPDNIPGIYSQSSLEPIRWGSPIASQQDALDLV